ncbi:uncharacterized protein [Gossypium hirsutum]|uniref:GAG-pre-integrase domain-containing protein n=1 Tax=Gossypium hirsutum TaxID=3635 RepID=A0ABM2ZBG5_GOSHI|nr:uncharacterized protein LOC121211354 [Gossypium hirsutum]
MDVCINNDNSNVQRWQLQQQLAYNHAIMHKHASDRASQLKHAIVQGELLLLAGFLVAASMSFSLPPLPIFAGENYNIWAVKMRTYLQARDLWNMVQNDTEPPPLRANPTIAQIRQYNEDCSKKYKAMSCLQSGVLDVIFTRIMACDSPKQAWDKLKEEFQGSEKTRQQQLINLRRDFENLRMKESETVKQYADRIMATVNNIRLLGDDFSDQKVVEKVITTLPEKYESKISSLEDSRDLSTIPLTDLINALYAQEQRRANRMESILREPFKPEAEKAQTRAPASMARSLGQKRRTKARKKPPKESFHLVLIARRPITLKNTAGTSLTFSVEGANSLDTLKRCVKTKQNHSYTIRFKLRLLKMLKHRKSISSKLLVLQARARSMFKELDTTFVTKVRIRNGELIEAKGKGKAVIGTKSGNKTISELLEKGYSLIFEGKVCVIKDAVDQVLATVAMSDRSFTLDVNQLEPKTHMAQADESSLWHRRLGHVNYKSLGLLHKMSLVEDMSCIEPKKDVCEV